MLLLLNTILDYSTRNIHNKAALIAGIMFFISGIFYKKLIYDKTNGKTNKEE